MVGSMVSATTRTPGRPVLASVHVAPPSVLLKTPNKVLLYAQA
jgi:hypothetical protein